MTQWNSKDDILRCDQGRREASFVGEEQSRAPLPGLRGECEKAKAESRAAGVVEFSGFSKSQEVE